MIEVVKGVEPPIGYGPILSLSEMESEMRNERTKRTKTVCTYCAVGCTFEVWTKEMAEHSGAPQKRAAA